MATTGSRLIKAGADVTFLVRPARADALEQQGPRVRSELGNFARSVKTITAGDSDGDYDLVLLSCKAYDLDAAMDSIAPAVNGRRVGSGGLPREMSQTPGVRELVMTGMKGLLLDEASTWAASMMCDLSQGARRIEADAIVGDLIARASHWGRDLPLSRIAYSHLQSTRENRSWIDSPR